MKSTLAILVLVAAVKASPFPQAVTAIITPANGPSPPGCTPAYAGSFGIAVMNITSSQVARRNAPVSQITDGQVQQPTATPVSQISDGQIQQPTATPVSQISDGQPQAGSITSAPTPMVTVGHVSMITDGQIQAHFQTMVYMPIAQQTDGQPTAMVTMAAVTQFIDGQPQAPTLTLPAVTQISDAQPQAPTPQTLSSTTATSPSPSPSPPGTTMVACNKPGTLSLHLADGILKDSQGRTGYIASNFQFQFDAPPQAGAIITAGFSICANGSLALGGSNVFYQCLSGSFYNLYNENWAPQCNAVSLNLLGLVNCA